MKIRKFTGGGISYLPTSNSGQAAVSPTAASSESTKFKQDMQKKLLELSNIEGLDNDVDKAVTMIEHYLNDPAVMMSTTAMNEAYLNIVRISNKVKNSYYDYKKASDRLESQDAWAEPAYASNGALWVTDGYGVKKTTSSDIPEGWYAMTNGELLEYRRKHPNMAFNTGVFDDLSGAIGMDTIVKWAEDQISKFKDTELTGYASKADQQIASGLAHITSMDSGDFAGTIVKGPDGVYKINQKSTIVDQSGIPRAMAYLLSTMPNSYKNALRAKAIAENYDPQALLATMLYANTGRTLTSDYDQGASKASGFGNANEDAQKLSDYDTYAIRIAQGLGDPERVLMSVKPRNPGDHTSISVMATRQGKLRDRELKPIIHNAPLTQILREMGGTDAVIPDNITFGDIVLNPGDVDGVIWDGISGLSEVWLPYKRDEHGVITPDWGIIRSFEDFKKEASGENSRLGENELMRKYGIDPSSVTKDDNGNWVFKADSNRIKLFLTFSGIASQKNLDGLKDSMVLNPMDDDQADHYRTLYKNLVEFGSDSKTKSSRKVSDYKGKGRLYRGNIFMPIDSYYVAAHQSRNQPVTKQSMTDFSGTSQAIKAINDMQDESIRTSGHFKEIN